MKRNDEGLFIWWINPPAIERETSSLVAYGCFLCGVNHIGNPAMVDTLWHRLGVYYLATHHPDIGTLTREDIQQHIGLATNVSTQAARAFQSRVIAELSAESVSRLARIKPNEPLARIGT